MENDKKVWMKISSFLKREMSFTLLFWLAVFLVVVVLKIWGLV